MIPAPLFDPYELCAALRYFKYWVRWMMPGVAAPGYKTRVRWEKIQDGTHFPPCNQLFAHQDFVTEHHFSLPIQSLEAIKSGGQHGNIDDDLIQRLAGNFFA